MEHASNVSAWLLAVGASDLPVWVFQPWVDRWVGLAGAFLLGLAAFGSFVRR